jgi:putative endonuclease
MAARGESASERGRRAEAAAAAWLERQGFEVLARNHSTRRGEVDLVCREGATICFVEVRSRSDRLHGSPAESVTPAKARRVAAAAKDWAVRNGGLDRPFRFDVVSVDWPSDGPPRLALYRGAFDAAGAAR